jgi:hypothetical protein
MGCGSEVDSTWADRLGLSQPPEDYELWINTYPESALVAIDDSVVGVTPIDVRDVKPGDHGIHVYRTGYSAFDTVITTERNKSTRLRDVALNRLVAISSVPSSAFVSINVLDSQVTTPCTLSLPAGTSANVSLKCRDLDSLWIVGMDPATDDGVFPPTQSWEIRSDSILYLTGTFKRTMTLRSYPSSAAIFVTGQDSVIGTTGSPLTLPCGEHDLTIRKQGFNEQNLEFDPCDFEAPVPVIELTHSVDIAAFSLFDPRSEITATVDFASDGAYGDMEHIALPYVLDLPARDCRVCVSAEGFYDTCVVVTAYDYTLSLGLRPVSPGMVSGDRSIRGTVTGRVEIQVVDKNTGEPIPRVDVIAHINIENRTVLLGVTDSNGIFQRELPLGEYEFAFAARGYKRVDKTRHVKPDDTLRLEIALKSQ